MNYNISHFISCTAPDFLEVAQDQLVNWLFCMVVFLLPLLLCHCFFFMQLCSARVTFLFCGKVDAARLLIFMPHTILPLHK